VHDAAAGGALCNGGAAGVLKGNAFFAHVKANVRVSGEATTRLDSNTVGLKKAYIHKFNTY